MALSGAQLAAMDNDAIGHALTDLALGRVHFTHVERELLYYTAAARLFAAARVEDDWLGGLDA